MKINVQTCLKLGLITMLFSMLMLLSPLSLTAGEGDPNGPRSIPEPGWSLWRPKVEIPNADFDSGFSNSELGGYLDFENACATKANLPNSKIDYWFRLSNSVNRIGTGKVDFGCWVNGSFLTTFSNTAIKKSLENVNCLRVNSRTGNGLVIWSEPRESSKRVGLVSNRGTVNPGSFPASIVEVDGQNWVAISSPRNGWISDGSPTGQGNLTLCKL